MYICFARYARLPHRVQLRRQVVEVLQYRSVDAQVSGDRKRGFLPLTCLSRDRTTGHKRYMYFITYHNLKLSERCTARPFWKYDAGPCNPFKLSQAVTHSRSAESYM